MTPVDDGDWTARRAAARGRHAARYDAAAARDYAATPGLGWLGESECEAYLDDLRAALDLRPGLAVLDVGAGSGALCGVLVRVAGLALTALEPSPAMLAELRARPELAAVTTVEGSTDAEHDGARFAPASFDLVVARQVANGLFDPLRAFRHWHRWLRPGGHVAVIEGLYGREDWRDDWAEEVDVLPLAASQTLATVPYLLEAAGFRIARAARMARVNALPTTRTPRYLVVAGRGAG